MSSDTWELFERIRHTTDPSALRSELTTLYAVLLLGRLAQLRETTLVRNGISPTQAEKVAYSTGVVLPEAGRRTTLARAGTDGRRALAAAASALHSSNPAHGWLFSPLQELSRMEASTLAVVIHTLDGHACSAGREDAAERFVRFARFFDDPRRGDGAHVTEDVARLTVRVLDAGSEDRVMVATEGLSPTLPQLLDSLGDAGLVFQAASEGVRREAAFLGILQQDGSVDPAEGEPLMHPLTVASGELRRFERICLEPPMGLRLRPREVEHLQDDVHNRFRFGSGLHQNTRELALAQHAMAALAEGGAATLLAPIGILFRGGREGDMRRALIEADAIEMVVALPSGTIEGTGIQTVLVKLVADKLPERRGQVLFVNVDAPESRGTSPLTDEAIEQIQRCAKEWTGHPRFARVVTSAEMAEADFVLQPNRFIDDFEPPPPIDWDLTRKRLAALEESARTHAEEVDDLLANPPC